VGAQAHRRTLVQIESCRAVKAAPPEVVEARLPVAPYAAATVFPQTIALGHAAGWTMHLAGVPSHALEVCGAMPSLAAQALENLFPATPMAPAVAFAPSAAELPQLMLAALPEAELDAHQAASDEVEVVPPSEAWMASPAACEVEREVWPVVAAALRLEAAVQVPGTASLAIAEPIIRVSAGLRGLRWRSRCRFCGSPAG